MNSRSRTLTPTRRQSAEATRARIAAAARELFVENGYRATSLREIAEAAGISHPGLLRHFASKDEILVCVVRELEDQNMDFYAEIAEAAEPGTLHFAELARRNAGTPGYLALFAALSGEASSPAHPAHEAMRERYRYLDEMASQAVSDAIDHGLVSDDRDPLDESIRNSAGWDGLQVIAQYLPERVDIVDMLETREDLRALPLGWRDPEDPEPQDVPTPIPPLISALGGEPDEGYAVGRRRRERIVADAMALFAQEGYGDTSLREVAEKVGVAKSTLLHHYPTKEALLRAVLETRDRGLRSRTSYVPSERAVDELRALPVGAADTDAESAGLIEVYAVLSSEAVPEGHPAHAYFAARFTRVIDHFAELFRAAQADGDLPSHRDPEQEALWLTAMWDGLQYRWLYDRDAVDVAAHLAAHLDDVLPR